MFDPNKRTIKDYRWGTYIPNRRPQFKVHSSLGLATSALKWRSSSLDDGFRTYAIPEDCTLWEHDGKEWIQKEFKHKYKGKEKIV